MLEKIFEPKNKRKIRFATLSSKKKAVDKMLDSKKQHQIKLLENLVLKKFDKNYVEKLTLLLYNSKNSNNYTMIRNNLNKSVLIFNRTTNEVDVTLPKLVPNSTTIINETTDNSLNKQHYINTSNNLNTNNSEKSNNKFQTNNRLIKYKTPINIKDLIFDHKKKYLFIKKNINIYKNKNNNHSKTLSNNLPKIQDLKYFNKNNNYEKYKINKNNCSPKKFLTNCSTFSPKQICEFDENLGKSLINGNISHLTNTQKQNLKFISELNIYPPKKNISKKQSKSLYSDLCNYDKKKLLKLTEHITKNDNSIKMTQINKENRMHIDKMMSDISKLQSDAKQQEEDIDILIKRNNEFMYGHSNKSVLD